LYWRALTLLWVRAAPGSYTEYFYAQLLELLRLDHPNLTLQDLANGSEQ